MNSHKILPFETASATLEKLRSEGKKIVQCHGTFDLVHPGHIYHLEEAKELGDILVVTITAEKYVNKGPGRPIFNDPMRTKNLSALVCVDYVVLIPHAAAIEAIECVKPNIYCKGREYEMPTNDVTGNIHDDILTVEKYGGEIRYIGSVVYSSTRLLNNHFEHVPAAVKEYCIELAKEFSPEKFREVIDDFSNLKVLVVGDIIFDRYTYVKVQGLTSKNRILSSRFLNEETHAGGALAIFRHIQRFTPHVKLLSLTGEEPWVEATMKDYLSDQENEVVRSAPFTTVVKQRFVEPLGDGKELSKLYSVNLINPNPIHESAEQAILQKLSHLLGEVDMVVVCDFGHGMMTDAVRRAVEASSTFFALNCQTNSYNHGFNIISRQYQRADCFTLDEQEMLLSVGQKHIDHVKELTTLATTLNAQYSWLTRGAVETIGIRELSEVSKILPLENTITDTVGAGDAFFSVAALSAKKQLPICLSTFIGQLAGAQAVKIVGNAEPISKQALLKSGMTLLNF